MTYKFNEFFSRNKYFLTPLMEAFFRKKCIDCERPQKCLDICFLGVG